MQYSLKHDIISLLIKMQENFHLHSKEDGLKTLTGISKWNYPTNSFS